MMKTTIRIWAILTAALAGVATAATLDDVRAKGFVQCGVSQGLPGFSDPDDAGECLSTEPRVRRQEGRARR